jgi:hypothetical protein
MAKDEQGFYLTETEKYVGIAAVLLVMLGVAAYIIFFSGWSFGAQPIAPHIEGLNDTALNATINASATATAKATIKPTAIPISNIAKGTPTAQVIIIHDTPIPPTPTPLPPAPTPSPTPIPMPNVATTTTISGGSGTFASGQVLTIKVTVTPGAAASQKYPGNVGLYVDNNWAALMTQTDATHYTAYLPVSTSVYPSGTQHFMTAIFSGDIIGGRIGSEATSFFMVS